MSKSKTFNEKQYKERNDLERIIWNSVDGTISMRRTGYAFCGYSGIYVATCSFIGAAWLAVNGQPFGFPLAIGVASTACAALAFYEYVSLGKNRRIEAQRAYEKEFKKWQNQIDKINNSTNDYKVEINWDYKSEGMEREK